MVLENNINTAVIRVHYVFCCFETVPPKDPFPTIDDCIQSSESSSCSVSWPEGTRQGELTCRVEGASVDLVNLTWSHGDNSDVEPTSSTHSPNADGETENITVTITANFSTDPYVCTTTVLATRFETVMLRASITEIPSTTTQTVVIPDVTIQTTTASTISTSGLSAGGRDKFFFKATSYIIIKAEIISHVE